jgi:hypothetical protein
MIVLQGLYFLHQEDQWVAAVGSSTYQYKMRLHLLRVLGRGKLTNYNTSQISERIMMRKKHHLCHICHIEISLELKFAIDCASF